VPSGVAVDDVCVPGGVCVDEEPRVCVPSGVAVDDVTAAVVGIWSGETRKPCRVSFCVDDRNSGGSACRAYPAASASTRKLENGAEQGISFCVHNLTSGVCLPSGVSFDDRGPSFDSVSSGVCADEEPREASRGLVSALTIGEQAVSAYQALPQREALSVSSSTIEKRAVPSQPELI
jgi:hypothetical protein